MNVIFFNRDEVICLTQSGADSTDAKFAKRIAALHRLTLGSPVFCVRFCMKLYVFFKPPPEDTADEMSESLSAPPSNWVNNLRDSKRSRPLAAVNSFCGLICMMQPDASAGMIHIGSIYALESHSNAP